MIAIFGHISVIIYLWFFFSNIPQTTLYQGTQCLVLWPCLTLVCDLCIHEELRYIRLQLLLMGFSRKEYWSGFPLSSPVDHVLSELSTMIHPSWVALHGLSHSFIELDKAVVHVIRLVSPLWLVFSLSAHWWRRIRVLWKLPDGRDWGGNWVLFSWAGPCSVNL